MLELRPYQVQGVDFLGSSNAVVLADEMGLGKTVQVAAALARMQSEAAGKGLIVCPVSVRQTWITEIKRWAPGLSVRAVRGTLQDRLAMYSLPFSVLVSTYETVRADAGALASMKAFNVVVLDEAQRIKNPNSEVALACCSLPRLRSWALTGTPIENHVGDLASIFRFVKPGLLSSAASRSTIQSSAAPYFLRRRMEQVFEQLPPIIDKELRLELEGEQLEAYEHVWASRSTTVQRGVGDADYGAMLALLTVLKQLCNFDPESNTSVKYDALRELFEDLEGQAAKLILFSQYVQTLEWLSDRIAPDFDTRIFHGGLSENERTLVTRWFEEGRGKQVLLVSLRAGGTGLNLPSATHVVLFDRWWNPAVEEQAIRRAYRFGRKRPLLVYKFLVQHTVEERIQEILDQKGAMFEAVVNRGPLADQRRGGAFLGRVLGVDIS